MDGAKAGVHVQPRLLELARALQWGIIKTVHDLGGASGGHDA